MLLKNPDFLKNILYTLQVPGYVGILCGAAALGYGEYLSLLPFFGIALLTIVPAWLLNRRLKNKGEQKIEKPLVLIALSYGVVSLIGAIPIYATAMIYASEGEASANLMNLQSPLNALFESFAGFTSSGLTMLKNPADVPHSIQLWRSLSQWVGGLGIFILAAFIFSPGDKGSKKLIKTEVGNIYTEEEQPNLVRQIWLIYIGFTLLAFVLFLLADQTVWISLNHALTSVSTGGFNVTNGSFEHQPLDAKIYSMLMMVVGALSFSLYWRLIYKRNLNAFKEDRSNLWFLIILLIGVVWMATESVLADDAPGLVDNIYQWVSALTTSGYQTTKIDDWESWKIFLLSIAMLVGGVGGSTAGGLKIRRVLLLFYTMRYAFSGRENEGYYNAISRYGEGENHEEIFSNFITMLGVWLMAIIISVISIAWIAEESYAVNHIIFEVISAQSNVGLSVGITSAEMHWYLKSNFILLMWMGRLELIAVIIMFRSWL